VAQIEDIEGRFTCTACGKRGADARPDFNWNKVAIAWIFIGDAAYQQADVPNLKDPKMIAAGHDLFLENQCAHCHRAAIRPEEWLLIEWPAGEDEPTKYWLSTLPQDITFARLVDLTKLRWRIERDYHPTSLSMSVLHPAGQTGKAPHFVTQ
jgi:hypothetical protein